MHFIDFFHSRLIFLIVSLLWMFSLLFSLIFLNLLLIAFLIHCLLLFYWIIFQCFLFFSFLINNQKAFVLLCDWINLCFLKLLLIFYNICLLFLLRFFLKIGYFKIFIIPQVFMWKLNPFLCIFALFFWNFLTLNSIIMFLIILFSWILLIFQNCIYL